MASETYRVKSFRVNGKCLIRLFQISVHPPYAHAVTHQLKQNLLPFRIGLHPIDRNIRIEGKCAQCFRSDLQLNDIGELRLLRKHAFRDVARHSQHKVQSVVVAIGIDVRGYVPQLSVPIVNSDIERGKSHIL